MRRCSRCARRSGTGSTRLYGCPPRFASATIGNSSPLAAWIVITRTTSSVSSATFASASSEEARWSESQRAKPRRPPAPEALNARAWSASLTRFAADCSPSQPASAISTSRVFSSVARTSWASETRRAEVVQVAQERERLGDALRAVHGVEPVVEAVTRGVVQVDLLVGAAEAGRAQARDERDLVERVVDRLQDVREVAHLLALEEGAAALGAHGDAGAAEGVEVDVERRAAREEDDDVAVGRGALGARVAVAHRPAALDRLPDRRREQRAPPPRGCRRRTCPPARRGRRTPRATRRRARRCRPRAACSRAGRPPARRARGRRRVFTQSRTPPTERKFWTSRASPPASGPRRTAS